MSIDPSYYLDENGNFSHDLLWRAEAGWAAAGDRTPNGLHCIRVGGWHFIAMPGIHPRRGFMKPGSVEMTWRVLATGELFTSNDVWCQGKIPEEFRELLPDNAEWI